MEEDVVIQFSGIDSWSKYAKYVRKIASELEEPIFRGQSNKFRNTGYSGWRLEPSLYRIPQTSHPRFIDWVNTIFTDTECQNVIAKTVGRNVNKDVDEDGEVVIGLMRHLGLPTPLLDWTKNPFVAAYFAFESIHETTEGVSIFLFDQKAWLTNENPLTSRDMEILKLQELEHIIPRQKAQESIYTYSRNERVYSELLGDELEGGDYFIAYCTLPIHDREKALKDLRKIGIYYDSLFPDEKEVEEMKNSLHDLMKGLSNFNHST
ncbi:MAG: hypothetical protein DRH43_08890 [Deltaproteobacteria bacterium]|nr:MAG: hypothetical protein DRH43_08890 [Deltaproteobacteria bacterium]